MANGDSSKTLETLQRRLEKLVDDDKTSAKQLTKELIRMYIDILPFLYQQKEDHDKIETMYPIVQIGKWVGAALGLADITLIVGIVTHTFHFP